MKKTTNYKGISWRQRERKWESVIVFNKIRHNCGTYDDERLAVLARDKRILKIGAPTKLLQILIPLKNETKNN